MVSGVLWGLVGPSLGRDFCKGLVDLIGKYLAGDGFGKDAFFGNAEVGQFAQACFVDRSGQNQDGQVSEHVSNIGDTFQGADFGEVVAQNDEIVVGGCRIKTV